MFLDKFFRTSPTESPLFIHVPLLLPPVYCKKESSFVADPDHPQAGVEGHSKLDDGLGVLARPVARCSDVSLWVHLASPPSLHRCPPLGQQEESSGSREEGADDLFDALVNIVSLYVQYKAFSTDNNLIES